MLSNFVVWKRVNSKPNDKNLDWSKLKVIVDDRIKLAKIIIFVLDRVENMVRKGENADYQQLLHFPPCFQKASKTGLLKVMILW